jgi:hypothetical protein
MIVSMGGTDTISGQPAMQMMAPPSEVNPNGVTTMNVTPLTTMVALTPEADRPTMIQTIEDLGVSYNTDISANNAVTPAATILIQSIQTTVSSVTKALADAQTTTVVQNKIQQEILTQVASSIKGQSVAELTDNTTIGNTLGNAVTNAVTTLTTNSSAAGGATITVTTPSAIANAINNAIQNVVTEVKNSATALGINASNLSNAKISETAIVTKTVSDNIVGQITQATETAKTDSGIATTPPENHTPTISGTASGAKVGTIYSFAPTAGDSDGDPLTFTISPALPSELGLIFNKGTGKISGIPTVSGNFSVTITASDGVATATLPVTLAIEPASTPVNQPPIAFNSALSIGSGMTVTGQLQASDPNGDSLTFSGAGVASNGSYAYTASLVDNLSTESLNFTVNDGKSFSQGKVIFTVYPYFNMNNVSANNGTSVSLTEFSATGISTGGEKSINTLNFDLKEMGTVLGVNGKNVKVAMQFKQGNEELSVALDDVLLYNDAQGMRIEYPAGAHMYGYYTNGTQTTAANLANIKEDLLTTVVNTAGDGTTFDTLSVQIKKMAKKFEDELALDSPLVKGTATGTYMATFIIDGVKVGSDTALQGTKAITINKPGGGTYITVSGSGVTGNVIFP